LQIGNRKFGISQTGKLAQLAKVGELGICELKDQVLKFLNSSHPLPSAQEICAREANQEFCPQGKP